MSLVIFLDFDGVLHPLWEPAPFDDWQLERTFGPRPWPGPFFIHAPVLVELLGPYLDQIEIVISSTWGRKRDLDNLRGLLLPKLAARVTDAVHHHLPPLEDFRRGHDLTSRWAEIAWYRRKVRPHLGGRWLAIDDDELGWPEGERHHLAHCIDSQGLGAPAAQAALREALAHWCGPTSPSPPPVQVGVQADRTERFIAHDPLEGASGRTYEATTADVLLAQLQAAGVDLTRVQVMGAGVHSPEPDEAAALRDALVRLHREP
ncbi:HAD domain-containing protein [Pseudoxanthomonas sp.]|uniref:HAD domain-containing protein n=1 Tax=Pseudoxanthomonas sp. TaxID=1871049 RepID=UPI00258369CC|nr:HAD domain-containing protein [Pseudoxanthomonas sp.]MCR6687075.1 HAD domain-containing protein [Pseudoxanthomonas sp.]